LLAVHLYGSAVDGGLKPHSDIDLLVALPEIQYLFTMFRRDPNRSSNYNHPLLPNFMAC